LLCSESTVKQYLFISGYFHVFVDMNLHTFIIFEISNSKNEAMLLFVMYVHNDFSRTVPNNLRMILKCCIFCVFVT
jgi:hypothetical protein